MGAQRGDFSNTMTTDNEENVDNHHRHSDDVDDEIVSFC